MPSSSSRGLPASLHRPSTNGTRATAARVPSSGQFSLQMPVGHLQDIKGAVAMGWATRRSDGRLRPRSGYGVGDRCGRPGRIQRWLEVLGMESVRRRSSYLPPTSSLYSTRTLSNLTGYQPRLSRRADFDRGDDLTRGRHTPRALNGRSVNGSPLNQSTHHPLEFIEGIMGHQ